MRTVYKFCKYIFSEKEKQDISSKMASDILDRQQAEEEKKAITSQYKAKIEEFTGRINKHAEHIRSGFEYRDIECRVEMDYETKVKRIYRIDTGELVDTEVMKESEYQKELPIDEEPEPDPDPFTEPESDPENTVNFESEEF